MKKILITGGKGFLAGRIIESYKNQYEFFAFGKDELDITDYNESLKICTGIKPDYILHLGAIADTALCEKNPELSYKINVLGTENMAKIAKVLNSKIIFASSEQVYNGTNKTIAPYLEDAVIEPESVYGKHKLLAEEKVKEILDEYIIMRLTWLFDMPKDGMRTNSNIIWGTLESLIKGNTIDGNINEFRGITYVKELVDNLEKILTLPTGIYNTGSENDLSRYETLKEIFSLFDMDMEKLREFSGNPRDIRIKNTKLSEFGIEFSDTINGIKKLCNDYNIGGKNV